MLSCLGLRPGETTRRQWLDSCQVTALTGQRWARVAVFAGWLGDPRQHQILGHRMPAGRFGEPGQVVGSAQPVRQMPSQRLIGGGPGAATGKSRCRGRGLCLARGAVAGGGCWQGAWQAAAGCTALVCVG